MQVVVKPIGTIRTPFKTGNEIPIQSGMSKAVGEAILEEQYVDGLRSLDGFSHIILLYWFHRAREPVLLVKPYLDDHERGLFSTRAPSRPNPIGLSTVKLLRVEGACLTFEGADMLDETPLLDIKPFVPEFDNKPDAKSGWLADSMLRESSLHLSDDRFHE
ncbi:tRNA (N6-threonylcarbamoyladenosine(37)-N6)-methyltransferase TrmO [Candidatus Thorarchaeota archaeon]|nr:MAG: tRNA (N6-threonylcarbamoyladenosine(37)-N6)-methyltransferase TrmO [Candidatus Thorarchaeota archaeon]